MTDSHKYVPVSVIIPTLNEEKNIEECLLSVLGWASEIIVIDAGSEDATLDIARRFTSKTFKHSFGRHNYVEQKNWALQDIFLAKVLILVHSGLKNGSLEISAHGFCSERTVDQLDLLNILT